MAQMMLRTLRWKSKDPIKDPIKAKENEKRSSFDDLSGTHEEHGVTSVSTMASFRSGSSKASSMLPRLHLRTPCSPSPRAPAAPPRTPRRETPSQSSLATSPSRRRETHSQSSLPSERRASSSASPSRRSRGRKSSSAGWTLGDFRVLRTLGTGYIGTVRAVQLIGGADPTPFALKVMKKREVIEKKQVDHVMQEVECLRRVAHPFVVRLLTTFQDDAHLFVCMEYASGGELMGVLRKARSLPPNAARFYAAEVILALGHVHSFDIAYRDLKPENILLDSGGHCKLADFGFAKEVKKLTWTMCGTPAYVAPEIITRVGHGKAVDWWALGVLTFEMLTGRTPFRGQVAQAIYGQVVAGKLTFPPDFPEARQGFVRELLNKDSARRLGAGGVEEVKGHTWVAAVDWGLLLSRSYATPFTPSLAGPDDTSMFADLPEEAIDAPAGGGISLEEQRLFEGF